MAVTVTEAVAEVNSTTNAATYSFGAFTPTANAQLIVMVFATGTTLASPTMSGGGLAWRLLDSQLYNTTDTAYVFTARVGSSPSSTTITFDCTGDNATGASMVAFSVTGNNPWIRQVKKGSGTTADPSLTMDLALKTDNAYVAAFGINRSTPTATSPGSGAWTEVADAGYSTPNNGAAGAFRNGGETGSTVTFTAASGNWAMFAVEVTEGRRVRLACSTSYPSSLPLTSWHRADFKAVPWTQTNSAGTSAVNGVLAQSGAGIGADTLINGRVPARFTGAGALVNAQSASNLISQTAYSIAVLMTVTGVSAPAAAIYDDACAITEDTSQRFGISFNSTGTVTVNFFHRDSGGYKSSSATLSLSTVYLLQMKYDGTNLKTRVNSGAWSSTAAGSLGTLGSNVYVGRSGGGTVSYLVGQVLEVMTSKVAFSDAEFDAIKAYCNRRYSLSL